jgi:hypothetical protein
MKCIYCLSLFLLISCDTIRPASESLMLDRRDTFIKSKLQFDKCIKKHKYSIQFEAKFQKLKTGFSGMFDSNPKLVVKDTSTIHFLKGELIGEEADCLKKVITKLELKVRDTRLSHEYFDVEIIRDIDKFDVELNKADYRNFEK